MQFLLLLSFLHVSTATALINRKNVVTRFNPTRHASSNTTPMQVGNGNFAFGADITGLQTFLPFATLSSWGWHNASLPTTPGQTSPADFTGLEWWTHGRLVNYDQPNPAEADISQWLIANPHRINLGRIGLHFAGQNGNNNVNVTESDLTDKMQTLDLYSGTITSRFRVNGFAVTVWTWVDPLSDTVAVRIASELLSRGQLGVFFDYPYATGEEKFEAPFVGDWGNVSRHETQLSELKEGSAQIKHVLDNTTYYTAIRWSGEASITPVNGTHRYILQPGSPSQQTLELKATFSPFSNASSPSSVDSVVQNCVHWWRDYWETGAFIDLTATGNATALEIQRRTILSQYLLAVNEAGHGPPQESGLVNNGWYGKFHMEMYLWHSAHWIPWGKFPLLERSIGVYDRFLPSSVRRAHDQGYAGARWGKMSDPTGRSAPGEINSLLIWQQPHVFYFAEMEYAAANQHQQQQQQQKKDILQKWDPILTSSADFMASFAFWNQSTGVYDLGPPMYPASENTNPNCTTNPTFELAYWRFGLDIAMAWKARLGQPVPQRWKHVAEHLAPLPTVAITDTNTNTITTTTYTLYEGIPNMWLDPATVTSHPALSAIYGLLPPTDMVNETIVAATAAQIARAWNFSQCWGWDFPLLAMNAVRLGEVDRAVAYLVHGNFAFDDVGMPVGSEDTAPTPYFPGAGALLLAVAMMAGGWSGSNSSSSGGGDSSVGLGATVPGFPPEWDVKAEGFMVML